MSQTGPRQRAYLWFAAVVLACLPSVLSLLWAMWRTPYPIGETVALLDDDLSAPSPIAFFDLARHSWYRPLFHSTFWVLWRLAGSLDGMLFWFKLFQLGAVVVLVALFLWFLKPRTFLDAAAATFAVAVLLGTPGLRTNLELPLLMTLVGMPLAMLAWVIVERHARWWHPLALVALTLIAIGYKEQGLVMAPVIVAAWLTDAPGATRTSAALVVLSVSAYLAIRLATRGNWATFEQDIGFGFGQISAADASTRFGGFPFWMYAYDAACTAANILLSEPTDGQFRIVADTLHRQLRPWELNHLLSSGALTLLIGWWGWRTLKNETGRPWSAESRMFVATVVAIAASGPLGFNYARDRLGGMAVPFYAGAGYFAIRAAAHFAIAERRRLAPVCVALLMLALGWQLRAVGTIEDVRISAAKSRREWMVDLYERRADFVHVPSYLRILAAMTPQGVDPASAQPGAYPAWLRNWLGSR